MCEPNDDWQCKFDDSPGLEKSVTNIFPSETTNNNSVRYGSSGNRNVDFTFPSGTLTADDEDEVTESKIIAFLDEKVSIYFHTIFPANYYMCELGNLSSYSIFD